MGWGIATYQVVRPVHPASQAISLQLLPAWNPRCLRHENGSNRTQRSNYSSSGGCWGVGGWARHRLGTLGSQLAGLAQWQAVRGMGAGQEPG